MAQLYGFLTVAVIVLVLSHYYLWRKLIRNTMAPGVARRLATGALVLAALTTAGALAGSRLWPRRVETAVAWPGYLWLAMMFYLVLLLAVLELPTLLLRRWLGRRARRRAVSWLPPTVAQDAVATRRLVLARATAITAGLVAAGGIGSGIPVALGPPRLRRIEIPLARLPRSADGTAIALVSDVHLGPLRGLDYIRRITELINSLDADVVAMVGDLVDGTVPELGPALQPLRGLRSRYGAYFVTGNHEYFYDYRQWVGEVAGLGLIPLRNERVELSGFDLAGVNDATGASFGDAADYDRALADRDPDRAVVLLAHQPVQAHQAARRGVDLQLSGHTHGGQIVPFNLVVRAAEPVVSGLGRVDGMPVYVTNGAGFWGPPVRVGAPPDITLVVLRAVG